MAICYAPLTVADAFESFRNRVSGQRETSRGEGQSLAFNLYCDEDDRSLFQYRSLRHNQCHDS